jgi:Holliday junction resolvase
MGGKAMSTASKGRALEHAVRNLFQANGWAVLRGAGSKGQFDCGAGVVKPDLIASKCTAANKYEVQIVLLQCKARKQ